MATTRQTRFSMLALTVLLGVGTGAIAACTAPTDNAETISAGEIVTLFVGPETADCVGVAPQQCLQVRYNADDEYELFYSSISGFDFVPGYDYELLVQKTPIANPPADGSSIEWTLVEIVSQTPAATNP